MTTTTPVTTPATNSSASTAQAAGAAGSQQIAGNFNEFLQLLTTQLQNQDPLSPLDTNQFTQQLVEFASVQQQVDMNTNMQTLISLQQTTAATQALQLVGSNVTLTGNTANLSNATSNPAAWTLNASAPGTAAITITNSSGQTAFTGTTTLNAGTQSYSWNGLGNNKVKWPDGSYTIAVTGTGASGQAITVTSQVQGTVSAVNMSQTPPTLTVNGQNYPISSIQSVGNGNSSVTSGLSSLNTTIGNLNTTITNLLQSL
ncbi:MAG TPA: flagellar hook capping FlgD N-terminal domain-containing protein [Xanthobacteraceae bacterium]|nr:flagellar hook capping FlgD N-terminal domain-containing protein [Xanthobacteraceae bacterium]